MKQGAVSMSHRPMPPEISRQKTFLEIAYSCDILVEYTRGMGAYGNFTYRSELTRKLIFMDVFVRPEEMKNNATNRSLDPMRSSFTPLA